MRLGLGLWCSPPSTIFQLYHGAQFLLVKEYQEKTTDLPQVNDKPYHIMLYWVHLAWAGFEHTSLVVIGTDCIGSCKSNYHTIKTTTASMYRVSVWRRSSADNLRIWQKIIWHCWQNDRLFQNKWPKRPIHSTYASDTWSSIFGD